MFAHGKFKCRKKSLGKKTKQNRPKKERRVPFCSEKKKNVVKATGTQPHTGVQISNKEAQREGTPI